MGKKQNLQSELPVEKLVELSINVTGGADDKHYIAYHTAIKRSSPVVSPGSVSPVNAILDKAGAERYLAQAKVRMANAEDYLRGLWQELERHSSLNGKSPEDVKPGGRIAEDIMEAACRLKVVMGEIVTLEKKLSECNTQEKQSERNRRLHQGVFKRDAKGKIFMADGMPVDAKGIIADLGIHVDQYLAECNEERNRLNESRRRRAELMALASE